MASNGSTINISGGIFGDNFDANNGSAVNIFGTEFFLNGLRIDDLLIDQAFTILDRGEDIILSGLLTDGTLFDFNLDDSRLASDDFFASSATVTVTRVAVPELGCGLTLATMSVLLLVRRRRTLD